MNRELAHKTESRKCFQSKLEKKKAHPLKMDNIHCSVSRDYVQIVKILKYDIRDVQALVLGTGTSGCTLLPKFPSHMLVSRIQIYTVEV